MKDCTCLFRNPTLHLDVNCPIHGNRVKLEHSVAIPEDEQFNEMWRILEEYDRNEFSYSRAEVIRELKKLQPPKLQFNISVNLVGVTSMTEDEMKELTNNIKSSIQLQLNSRGINTEDKDRLLDNYYKQLIIQSELIKEKEKTIDMCDEKNVMLQKELKMHVELVKRLRIDIFNRIKLIQQHSMYESLTTSLKEIDDLLKTH